MAATVDTAARQVLADSHEVVTEMQLSALTSGLEEDFAHGGPDGVVPDWVEMRVVTRPNDGSPISMSHSGNDRANNEINVRFDTAPGGSLTGAVVQLRTIFKAIHGQPTLAASIDPLGNRYTAPIV